MLQVVRNKKIMKNKNIYLQMNMFWKLFFTGFLLFACYAIYVSWERTGFSCDYFSSRVFLKMLIGLPIVPFLLILAFFFIVKIDEEGIWRIFGIIKENGEIHGWHKLLKWNQINIKLRPFPFVGPLVTYARSGACFSHAVYTNYKEGMRLLYKYAKDRIVLEEDKEYFEKLLKEE